MLILSWHCRGAGADESIVARGGPSRRPSMGKFDRRLAGEKPGERQPLGKRRKHLPVADNSGTERTKAVSLVDRMLRERTDDIVDVNKCGLLACRQLLCGCWPLWRRACDWMQARIVCTQNGQSLHAVLADVAGRLA